MTDKIVVLSTCATEDDGTRIARELVGARLAACVNVLPGVRSFYWWQGALEESNEWLLVIKSSRPLFDRLCAALEAAHRYDVPEIVAVPVVDGSTKYLDWLQGNLENE